MSRASVLICCEGQCSDAYRQAQEITKLRAAGWQPEDVRSHLSSTMKATTHLFHHHEPNKETMTRVLYYECSECGHVRVFGAEEM